MLNIKFDKKDLFKDIEIEVDLKKIGEELVKDHEDRINKGYDINNKKFPKNKKSTIASKGFNHPLVDTKKLLNSFYYRFISKNEIEMTIKEDRLEVAGWMNDGTDKHKIPKTPLPNGKYLRWFQDGEPVFSSKQVKHPGTPKYNFFGISLRFQKRLDKILSNTKIKFK